MEENAKSPRRHRRLMIGAAVVGVVILALGALMAVDVFNALEDQDSGLNALEATAVDATTLPQTVPFRTVAGHILVDATLDGSADPIEFILDTGAPTTYSDDVATRFGGEAVGHITEVAIDGTKMQQAVVPVATLEMGGLLFRDVAGIEGFLDPDNPLSCISQNGIIGASLMKEAVWQIDYAAQELTIASSVEGLDHIDGAITLDFTSAMPASPSPLVLIPAEGETLGFLLDTGSDGGLTVNPADLEAIGVVVDGSGPSVSLIGAGSAGTFAADLEYAGVDLDLGDVQASDYPVAVIDTMQAGQGNIGSRFLDDFVTTIDWPGGKIYLDPVAADGSLSPPRVPQAARLSWDGGNVIIGSVVQGTAAAEAGLVPGETVTSIDGRSLGSATRDDFCALYVGDPPESTVVVTDDGQSHAIGPVEGFFDSLSE